MDELIRGRMHEALDAIQPPPNLTALNSITVDRSSPRSTTSVKFEPAFGLIAALLAVAIVAGLLYARGLGHTVPANPTVHAVPPREDSGMVSPTVGWKIGPGGHVFRTTDSGGTWVDVTPRNYVATSVVPFFYDANRAWITQDASSTSILVVRTTDGGKSWQSGAPFAVAGLRAFGARMDLFFLDSDHGWLLGNSVNPLLPFPDNIEFEFLYRTTDGGAHWMRMADTRAHPPACPWSDLAYTSRTTGWMATYCGVNGGKPDLLVTHDGGATWQTQALPVSFADGTQLVAPFFFDNSHGVLAAQGSDSQGTLLVTSDGGMTWSQRPLPGTVELAGNFVDPDHGWVIAGPSGLVGGDHSLDGLPIPLYRTDDGGRSWKAVTNNLPLVTPYGRITDLYFLSRQYGFAVATVTAAYTTGSNTLYATSDGGATWTLIGPIPT